MTLSRVDLDRQRGLVLKGTRRHTYIEVTVDGVVSDGHHGVRAASEFIGQKVDVRVIGGSIKSRTGLPVTALPVIDRL